MKVKILGISASPRKNANTDYMVKMALLSARQIKDVETEFIHLRDYKYVSGCIDCKKCDKSQSLETLCEGVKDDHNKILKKEIAADGFIWGSPVYIQGVTWLWKMWMDRHEPFAGTGSPIRNKPVGCVTVGDCRSGGQPQVIEDMFRAAYMWDMIPIGAAVVNPFRCTAGIHGACAVKPGWPEVQGQDILGPEAYDWVKYDKLAMENCLVIGARVAEMAKIIKGGFTLFNPENGETRWPVGLKPKEQYLESLVDEYEEKGIIPRIERKGSLLTYDLAEYH
jgi:multimeric flavodoxin WrbA